MREAHAQDEWAMVQNERHGVSVFQPTTHAERAFAACSLVSRLEIDIPVVVDGLDDAVGRAYGAWPERLYVVGADGRIAYQGGFGPFDFHPQEVEAWLAAHVGPRAAQP